MAVFYHLPNSSAQKAHVPYRNENERHFLVLSNGKCVHLSTVLCEVIITCPLSVKEDRFPEAKDASQRCSRISSKGSKSSGES